MFKVIFVSIFKIKYKNLWKDAKRTSNYFTDNVLNYVSKLKKNEFETHFMLTHQTG